VGAPPWTKKGDLEVSMGVGSGALEPAEMSFPRSAAGGAAGEEHGGTVR
jgi:hypothetical protein